MSWLDVLNASGHRVALGGGAGSVEILQWAYEPHLRDNTLHRHTFVEACFVGRYGAGCFTVGGQKHAIGAGDAFFARPGVLHRIQNTSAPDMELFWVSFSLAPDCCTKTDELDFLQLARAFFDSPILIAPDDGGVAATWNALRVVAEAGATQPAIRHLKAALVLSLLRLGTPDHTSDMARTETTRNAAIARVAVRYIHDNLDRRLPVSEVAAYVHLSPRHLVRLMHAHAGTAPADYIEQARLDRARALLRGSDLPLKAIAAQVGYSDAHHFSRAFTKRFAIAPGAFRRGDNGRAGRIQHDGTLV